jgi:hypothetical protein
MIDNTRDRVIALEVKVDNLRRAVEDRDEKIDEMHDILLQAKGARYVIVAAAAIAGAITGFLVKLVPFTHTLQK